MLTVRRSEDRGRASFGWLEARHTFSFGSYVDPDWSGFRSLRVINEDRIQPGTGFGTHPHRDMEILTYVIEGAIEHKDSLGSGSVLVPGELQRMTAGTGISHSEFNPSPAEPLHLLQIWVEPETNSLAPSYDQRAFPLDEQRGRFVLVASRDGREGSLVVHQDAALFAGRFDHASSVRTELVSGRHAWIQVVRGEVSANGTSLRAGDGAAVSEELSIDLTAESDAEVLLFDLG